MKVTASMLLYRSVTNGMLEAVEKKDYIRQCYSPASMSKSRVTYKSGVKFNFQKSL